jgi:hypothetical protein
VPHIDTRSFSASFAIPDNVLGPADFEDNELCFGILARLAENELVDETIKKFAETVGVVGTVNDVPLVLFIARGLGT